MSHFWRQRWRRWLAKRLPPKRRQQLSHRSIFILPSAAGWAYLVMCLLLFVLGTNYQNNLILALSFLLLSVFHTSLLMAFRNLSGLEISAGNSISCHPNQLATFQLSLTAERPRFHLRLQFADGDSQTIDVDGEHPSRCELTRKASTRGRFNPGRIWIETRYPLGLCRAWSVQDLALEAIVWPTPITGELATNPQYSNGEQHSDSYRAGLDDFHGLTQWQPGENQSKIAWKQLAQSGTWQVKEFIEPLAPPTYLTLPPAVELEVALSRLTGTVIELERNNYPYALQLGQQQFGSDLGPAHLTRCLDALALYQEQP